MGHRVENHVEGNLICSIVIQGQYVTVTLPDRPDPATAGLPKESSTFVGREDELAKLMDALPPGGPKRNAPVVAVSGLPGMGKTELLLQAARRALSRTDWFPGGALYLDMHGYEKRHAVSPKKALATLLQALGISPEHIPRGAEERARVFKTVLAAYAEADRRLLLILDDLPPTSAMRHLLPSDGSTVTLLAARHSVAELDALSVPLEKLSKEEGHGLLGEALRAALPGDPRLQAEEGEAARLAALCDGLPLALRILASLLVEVPIRPLADLRRDFEKARSRLTFLAREKQAVTAAFELFYRALTKEHARIFRLLAVHPGPDFSTEATAHLSGLDEARAKEMLLALARRHLVSPRQQIFGRWHMHGLVRAYAGHRLKWKKDGADEALVRLLGYLHERAETACRVLSGGPGQKEGVAHTAFAGADEALRWMESERLTLTAACAWSHAAGDDLICVALAVPLSLFLVEMRYSQEAVGVIGEAIVSSRRMGDAAQEAELLSMLGLAFRDLRKLGKSVRTQQEADRVVRRLKDVQARASILNNKGMTLCDQGRYREAREAHTEAARLFKSAGDRAGRAKALSNLGETLAEMGCPEDAVPVLRKAAKMHNKSGNRRGRSQALGTLATTLRNIGRLDEALRLHQRALDLPNGLVFPRDKAVELGNMGATLVIAGQLGAAEEKMREALSLFQKIRDRQGEARMLGNLALLCQERLQWRKAIRLHTVALEVFDEVKDDRGLADELSALSRALRAVGNNSEAVENLELAAILYGRAQEEEHRTKGVIGRLTLLRRQLGIDDSALAVDSRA